ncbi:MAG: ABC transporter substrate-binding protein [Halanaerobiales bacterium]
MENRYFSPEETILTITDRYPELIPFLVSKGFTPLQDEKKRKMMGGMISLKNAVRMKGLNLDGLVKEMVAELDKSYGAGSEANKEIRVEGLVPCPVRIPLQEELDSFISRMDNPVILNLKAASQGVDWLEERFAEGAEGEELADIFISAGFDLFFDWRLMERYRRQGLFKDNTGIKSLNRVFAEQGIDLLDPEGDYSILAVVPAVFLVNKDELDGRSIPQSWEDILSDDFIGDVSLPVSDFDLFNAILLNLYKKYGEEGIERLGRSMLKAQHPAQMIKEGGRKKSGEAAVTVMPYFFTRMARRFPHFEFVWPADGAIISPIFMLTKKDSFPAIQPLVDFFASRETGEIFAHQGLFPSVRPDIDNRLPEGVKFMWPGWEFLRKEDPGKLLEKLIDKFNNSIREE